MKNLTKIQSKKKLVAALRAIAALNLDIEQGRVGIEEYCQRLALLRKDETDAHQYLSKRELVAVYGEH